MIIFFFPGKLISRSYSENSFDCLMFLIRNCDFQIYSVCIEVFYFYFFNKSLLFLSSAQINDFPKDGTLLINFINKFLISFIEL